MIRSTAAYVATLGIAFAVFTLAAPSPGLAQRVSSISDVPSAVVAQQLGVRLSPSQPEELGVGTSLTSMLVEPARLVPFGVSDAKAGARVTITRTAPERVRVEIDELEPTRSRVLTLRLHADGRLSTLTP